MNKIDTGSISFYIIQILRLAATSEICEIPVCGLTTDIKMKHIYIYHPGKLSCHSHFIILDLLSSFLTLFFLSYIHSLSRCFLSFSLFFENTSYSSFFTTRNTQAKIFQCCPLCCSTKRFNPHLKK